MHCFLSADSLPLRTIYETTGPPEADEPRWTAEGLAELLDRLDDEGPVQAEVIRAAARQPDGRLPRALVYELGAYEAGRTLRGFTRPVNRITRQLQREGLVAPSVAPALEAIYEYGVQATYLAVPADVQVLLWKSPAAIQRPGAGQKKNTLQGSDEFLTRIADGHYQNALRYIFDSLAGVDGLTTYWGTTGCSLRVAVPGRGPLSVGWAFPPGIPRWMGLTDLTLGWYDAGQGIEVSDAGQAALDDYLDTLSALGGEARPDGGVIRGWTFRSAAVTSHAVDLAEAIRVVTYWLREN